MKAAILIESLTGNTWKAGELIAANLQQEKWSITGISSMKDPNHASIQDADTVIVGTWVHGLFVVGQAPWAIDRLRHLPAMAGKQAVAFCTYAQKLLVDLHFNAVIWPSMPKSSPFGLSIQFPLSSYGRVVALAVNPRKSM